MPQLWIDNKVAVTYQELVPRFWSTKNSLMSELYRYANKPYGLKRLQLGGHGRQLLVDYDTLKVEMQEVLSDPRKDDHILEEHYTKKPETILYYANYTRPTGTLNREEQKQYVVNATMLEALVALESKRASFRSSLKNSTGYLTNLLLGDAISFNKVLLDKYGEQHNLPQNLRRFKQRLKTFKTDGLYSVIKDPHGTGKMGRRKVYEKEVEILNGIFATQEHKPTSTEVLNSYDSFLAGYIEVFSKDTGELYNPKDFPKLSESTIRNYLHDWSNGAALRSKRSGDNVRFVSDHIPSAQMAMPKYAGSILSIDDRQPPFWYDKGKRMWFYIGLDVASGAFTTFVYGKSKTGLIIEFYRQMVRNYTQWNLHLPYELECEMSLNSSFRNSFLKEGELFQKVKMEANNPRSKIIERRFGSMRYEVEKKSVGWIARPSAKSEANQIGKGKETPKIIPYKELVNERLKDIEDWNNMPHHEDKNLCRWEYFLKHQHAELSPINYKSILPYIGHSTPSSCKAGYITLQGKQRALADAEGIVTGQSLINIMKQVEGKDVMIYWLDDNNGEVLKALVYIGEKYICEIMKMPTYNRAVLERTDADIQARSLQQAYKKTIQTYISEGTKAIVKVGIIKKEPPKKRVFQIGNINRYEAIEVSDKVEIVEEYNDDDDELINNPSIGTAVLEDVSNWKKQFQ